MRRRRSVGVVAAIGLACLAVLLIVSYAKRSGLFAQGPNTRPICVFRYDDYSSRSHTEIEENLLRMFERHGIPVVFAVIPFVAAGDFHDPTSTGEVPLTPEKAQLLRRYMEYGMVTAALHGYSHRRVAKRSCSEFAGVPLQEQREKIAKGRQLLGEMLRASVDIFVPPWHGYDASTVAVLEECGFSCLSAGVQ